MATAVRPGRSRQAAAIATAVLALEKRNGLGLAAAIAVPVGHFTRAHGDPDATERAIVMAASLAIAAMVQGSEKAARKSWVKHSALEAASAAPVDVNRPVTNAGRLSRAWRTKFDAVLVEKRSVHEAADEALEAIQFRVNRVAAYETLKAWNEETIRQNDIAFRRGVIVTETWEATLDMRTCPRCASMDGTSVVRPETFDEAPPLHPFCRCFLTSQYNEAA